jgi:translation initiation factor IF-1
MKLAAGDRVKVESESTERAPRTGVIAEVMQAAHSPRYRIRWDDGHESIYTPAAGAVSRAEPTEEA